MESIKDFGSKIKTCIDILVGRDFFVILVLICVAFSSFALGRLSVVSQKETSIRFGTSATYTGTLTNPYPNVATVADAHEAMQHTALGSSTNPTIIASRNGKKYYFLWCSGASRITKPNAVYFATKESAEKRGYTLAASCKE